MLEDFEDLDQEAAQDIMVSSMDIEESEYRGFVEKWGDEHVEVPIPLLNFDGIEQDVVSTYPDMFEDDFSPVKTNDDLDEMIGEELSCPLIEYINMGRRSHLRQCLNLFLKTGFVNSGLSITGELEYVRTDKKASDSLEVEITRTLESYAKF